MPNFTCLIILLGYRAFDLCDHFRVVVLTQSFATDVSGTLGVQLGL